MKLWIQLTGWLLNRNHRKNNRKWAETQWLPECINDFTAKSQREIQQDRRNQCR